MACRLRLRAERIAVNLPGTEPLKTRIETLIALARLLERVETSSSAIGADQYRSLVRQLQVALQIPLPQTVMDAILSAHPATAELYENLHYEASGLSRSALERSVSTEMLAAEWIHKARRAA